MSERTPLVQAARDVLASEPVVPTTPSASEDAAIIAAMASEIVRARRRRIATRTAIGAVSVAASVMVTLFALRARRDDPRVHLAASAAGSVAVTVQSGSVSASSALFAGDHLLVPQAASAQLALSTGTTIEATSNAEITVASLGSTQSFTLSRGGAEFRVAKLTPEQRFLVQTPDAEVEVRGTRFRVTVVAPDPSCGGGTRTRVDVSEGVVEVRHGGEIESLHAGGRWPMCASSVGASSVGASSNGASSSAVSSGGTPPRASPAGSSSPPSAIVLSSPSLPATASATSAPPSSLAAQNELFAASLDAKKRGDRAAAVAGFERYLARFPHGFLVESAEAERMRLLSGPARVTAAKGYLAHHPQGFARAEAKAIVDASP